MADPTTLTQDSNALGIERERKVISLDPKALTLGPVYLHNLATDLILRYEQFGRTEDLERQISLHRDALDLCPPGHPLRPASLNNLANGLTTRYERFSQIEDLERAISLYHNTLDLCPAGVPLRSTCLYNLASSLKTRYEHLGNTKNLELAIQLYHDALDLHPAGHPLRSYSLNGLADGLRVRYEQWGNIEDLEEAIQLYHDALDLCPPGVPLRATSLNNIAGSLRTRYERLGNTEDLEQAIQLYHDALDLHPASQPFRSYYLNDLADGLRVRYEQLGNIEDLEHAISLHRDSLDLRPPGHAFRSYSLNGLANGLRVRYERLGHIEDLELAISLHQNALDLRPSGHHLRYASLTDLANSLHIRYKYLDNIEDFERSMSLNSEALNLCPPGHPFRSASLKNLANSLMSQYDELGNTDDLEQAISLHYDTLDLCPPGHPLRSYPLNDLGNSLRVRYERLGNIEDLEQAISFHQNALNLRSPGHRLRHVSLGNLASCISIRSKDLTGNIEDLNTSISLNRELLILCPPGYSFHSKALISLAYSLNTRYKELGKMEDLEEMFARYEQATNDTISYLSDRLWAALKWTKIAQDHRHHSTLNAYTISLNLVHRSLVSRPDVKAQQAFLASAKIPRYLASDAASAAIEEKKLELAVEFLEQGRAMLWSRIDAYKSPLEDLHKVQGGTELANRLEMLSSRLENLVLLSDRTTELDERSLRGARSFDSRMQEYRILAGEWEGLVGQIRKIEGFSHFLQTLPFDILRSAAAEGPVILINISGYRSDAIILTIDNPPDIVPLSTIDPAELRHQPHELESNRGIVSVLRYLWTNIVKPVVTRLAELKVEHKSRIWWCPTAELCALPLHAAGPYRPGQKNLPDIYISSYTSTLTSLIRARFKVASVPRVPKLLVVGQGHRELKKVEEEVRIIMRYADNVGQVLLGDEATPEAVLDGLQQHSWVHFACKSHPGDNNQPFQASFELCNDSRLTLLELIQARLPNAECAFLATCRSAAMEESDTPDESIHFSTALQFCGFRSVVGTLWEMLDDDGPTISQEFYNYIFRNPERIDFRDSARALNLATLAMRKAKLPPQRWAMFVHIGA